MKNYQNINELSSRVHRSLSSLLLQKLLTRYFFYWMHFSAYSESISNCHLCAYLYHSKTSNTAITAQRSENSGYELFAFARADRVHPLFLYTG
jgi:hypothetical protein